MHERIEVIYENGVFRPLGPLPGQIQEHEHVTVTIEPGKASAAPVDAARLGLADEARRQSLLAARKSDEHEALAFIEAAADIGNQA